MIPLVTNIQPEPMSPAMFEAFKKHLPKNVRKQVEMRHEELQKIQEEREREQEIKLSEVLDSDTLIRFAYVPFVIAALAWDYADTILNMARMLQFREVKKLSRAVIELKRDYDNVRAPFIDTQHQKSEEDNMYVFEDAVNDVFNVYLANIGFDIKREYPELEDDHVLYIKAIYQCHIVLQSIYKYVGIISKKVEKIVGHSIGDILPKELRRLDTLVMAYVGDKPASDMFERQQDTYAKTLANRMLEIELNATDE